VVVRVGGGEGRGRGGKSGRSRGGGRGVKVGGDEDSGRLRGLARTGSR
jgi:hypothetical protein